MRVLIKNEFVSLISSPIAIVFLLGYLLSVGLMNWFFPGAFNILDNGYATLNKFFELSSVLLLIFIPTLTMRSFSEEKRSKNLEVFRARPQGILSLYMSKLVAIWLIVIIALFSTLIFASTVYQLSLPLGNVDLYEITASYMSLILLSLFFIVTGLLASSLSSNQVISFIVAISLNFALFYGFDLLAVLFSTAKSQLMVSSWGLFKHYELMQKGVFHFDGLLLLMNYVLLFSLLSIFVLNLKNKRSKRNLLVGFLMLAVVNVLCFFVPDFRFDFTADKRYTLNDYSKQLMSDVAKKAEPLQIVVYLEGDLNPGFQRLHEAIKDILTNLTTISNGNLTYSFVNPSSLGNTQEDIYVYMADRGMRGLVLNEMDRQGKSSQKLIYPYTQIIDRQDTLMVNLLKSIGGYSAEENLNASIENIEFEFIDAINILQKEEERAIAFIEGHGEIPRPYVYDAEELLSKYYNVNRGQIGNDVSVLQSFEALIIAGTTEKFNDQEKFILDQYIMSGGRVLWLIDGAYLSEDELKMNAQTPVIKNETNLDDMLFAYGVRINPVLLQDRQSSSILVSSGDVSDANSYTKVPWYYSALLLPSIDNSITKDISLVKAEYASYIDVVHKSEEVEKHVLLTTSDYSRVISLPEMVTLEFPEINSMHEYFNQSFLPVAVSLNGIFTSSFINRPMPDSIVMNNRERIMKSKPTKMILVSSSDIIKNEIVGDAEQSQMLPMGYDRVSERQYGNRDFVVNAVNWLADDGNILSLRTKTQKIRVLDRSLVYSQRDKYAAINIIVPLLFSILFVAGFYCYRKYKYEK